MDFRNILQSLNTLTEGDVSHKAGPGGYGNRHGSETQTDQYGKPIGKVSLASLAPKDDKPKTRGRPVDPDKPKTGKDDPKNKKVGDIFGRTTGDVPKGKKGTKFSKMGDADKAEKKAEKKKSLKEFIDVVEANKQLDESEGMAEGQLDEIGDTPAGQAALQKYKDKAHNQVAAHWQQVHNKSYLPTNPKMANRNAGAMSAGNRIHGYGIDKNQQDRVTGRFKYRDAVGLSHVHQKNDPLEQGLAEYGMSTQAPVQIKPATQTNTQVIQQGNKTLGTVTNPQLAAQIKQSIGKGEMTLNPNDQEMAEDGGEKWIQKAIKHPGAFTKNAKAAHMGTQAFAKKHAHDSGKLGKQARLAQTLAKMHESLTTSGTILTEGELKQTMLKFFDELSMGPKGYNINTAVDVDDKGLATSIINKTLAHGRFKAMSGTFKDQLRDAALEHFGFTNYDESLEEADLVPHPSKDMYRQHAIQHGVDTKVGDPNAFKPSRIQSPKVDEPTPWSRDPIAAASDRAINFISGLGKPKSKLESTEMKDVQLESWEKELNNLLNEGITVSTSTGQQGAPDSVSINATDNDANELLNILRQSGMGVFGGNDKPTMTPYGVMSQGEEEPTGTGTEPEMSPEVVGDGDDMLSLIKKMSGLSAGPVGQEPEGTASSDYEDEEGSEEQSADTEEPEQDSEEKTDEGNAFSGAVAKAKKDGIQPGEKINVGGKQYPVKEDEMEEGNKFTGNLAKARAQSQEEADLDGDGDMEKVKEGHDHEMCNECGGMMYEGHTCEEEQVEEGFSNDAGGDAMADTELAKLKALLTMGDDLHKMKRSQSVGNPTQVSMAESLAQWKRLSGIK
jgi:hypothetical protein